MEGCPYAYVCDRGFKVCDKPKIKALFNWEIFAKLDLLGPSDIPIELYWYKFYIKTGEFHLLILSIDWSWS